ncbi:MAG: nuclear transport factor 2 family protein [Anaerolineae bacterium]|nr:nuclear transport factor 2 family protein [Anaerolineae bacterium]
MTLTGKGIWIWQLPRCENGDPEKIADAAARAGFSHVLIKVANGMLAYNVNPTNKKDLVPPVAEALRSRGIQVWGWHYIYGFNPVAEANIAVQRVKQMHLDGYVINAEQEFKQPGMAPKAAAFMKQLRNGLRNTPVALSSYRYPKFHPELPWKEFLSACDYNMPQVYWEQAHNPAAQLERSLEQFRSVSPIREIIPTGSLYKTGGWLPSPSDVSEFFHAAFAQHLKAVNLYVWDHRIYLQPQWNAAASFDWQRSVVQTDIAEAFFQALNTHDPKLITNLYDPRAVLITAGQTVQGTAALQSYYARFFTETAPESKFAVTGYKSNGNTRHITWRADGKTHRIENGTDTLGTRDGKILYHYSYFRPM